MKATTEGNVVAIFQVKSNELSTPRILFCNEYKRSIQASSFSKGVPVDGIDQTICLSNNSNVSYFVGLDAENTSTSMFLSGDDNWLSGGEAKNVASKGVPVQSAMLSLWTNTSVAWSDERHKKNGNMGMADGSVQGFSSSRLAEALRNTGVATNRLVFP